MSIDADIDAGEDLFGKTVSDLQSGVSIDGNAISGTLKYVADYSSAFSGDEASGNYIALHFSVPEVDDATITVKVTNPVTLDDDGIAVLRIRDKSTQTITVVASKPGFESVTKVYSLTGLTCLSE